MSALLIVLGAVFTTVSCKKDKDGDVTDLSGIEVHDEKNTIAIDTAKFDAFFSKYPKYKEFRPEIKELYRKHRHYVWHDKDGVIEFAQVLYNEANQLDEEGVEKTIPYKNDISSIFYSRNKKKPTINEELLISSMYFYFTKKKYEGLDKNASKQTGWFLPREKTSYVSYLDTLMRDPGLIQKDESEFFSQYYKLKKGLKKYRDIEKKGGWGTITLDKGVKSLKPGDSASAIAQVRTRLYKEGYLKNDNKKNIYDDELLEAVNNYDRRNNKNIDSLITPGMIKELNVPVAERIKTISVNMERCRWITPSLDKAEEYIAVNIPSYRLQYFQDGEPELTSRVVVGKELNKTVVFSGNMSYLAFSPYWNVPESILEKEIRPKLAENPNYLAEHNMEWVEGAERVRQKPGGSNALGLVKFIFPNSNNIYLHDTPSKSLFNKEDRAFSHGCVRVQKARDLAVAITKKHGGWSERKVDEAMHADSENIFSLKKKIPVYISYFTAWADDDGNVGFYDDIYNRDNRLASLLYRS